MGRDTISGHVDKEIMLKLMLKGCEDYIPKPVEPEFLIERVNKVFAKR